MKMKKCLWMENKDESKDVYNSIGNRLFIEFISKFAI